MSRGASAISKPHTVAVLRHFLFDSRREDCRDIVDTGSGPVRRPNRVLPSAGYIRDNETRAVCHLSDTASTTHARSGETFRVRTEAPGGSEKRSYPISEATAV